MTPPLSPQVKCWGDNGGEAASDDMGVNYGILGIGAVNKGVYSERGSGTRSSSGLVSTSDMGDVLPTVDTGVSEETPSCSSTKPSFSMMRHIFPLRHQMARASPHH